MRKPPKLNKTGLLLLSLGSVFLILLVLYLAVLSPYFAEEAPDKDTTTLEVGPGEGVGLSGDRLLLFPRVERAKMLSITVYNSYNSKTGLYETYCFEKDSEDADGDGDKADFIIQDFPAHTYDEELFAYLVVDAGYTVCEGRLVGLDFEGEGEDAIYTRYGLHQDQHPAYYILKAEGDVEYTVYIGAKTPDGKYYARVAGRSAVYILQSTLSQSLLAPLTSFVEPNVTFAADVEYGYVYIRDFSIFHDRSLVDSMFGQGSLPDVGEGEKLSPFVMFTFLPSYERDVYRASAVYTMLAPFTSYAADDGEVDGALARLPGLQGIEVLKLGLSDADFAEGGLLANVAYTIYYEMPYGISYDINEDPIVSHYVKNLLFVTPLASDNTYTVGSLSYTEEGEVFYNMIARVEYEELSFLEYSLFNWVSDEMCYVSIDDVAELEFSSAMGDYHFKLNGDGTAAQTVEELYSGYRWFYKDRGTPFSVNEQGYCDDISQFRDLYMLLLRLCYSGEIAEDTGWTAEEIEDYMADDSRCLLSFCLTLEDGRRMTYQFYPYSERHAMVTVSGDQIDEVTTFYTSSTSVRRVASAVYQLMNGIEIDPDHRYD